MIWRPIPLGDLPGDTSPPPSRPDFNNGGLPITEELDAYIRQILSDAQELLTYENAQPMLYLDGPEFDEALLTTLTAQSAALANLTSRLFDGCTTLDQAEDSDAAWKALNSLQELAEEARKAGDDALATLASVKEMDRLCGASAPETESSCTSDWSRGPYICASSSRTTTSMNPTPCWRVSAPA